MKISEKVLKFLNREDVQSALVRNDMQELYKLVIDAYGRGDFLPEHIGELTSLLMQAGIHPLEGMTEIPTYFLCGQEGIKSFSIPVGITRINSHAFAYADLENITIPNSVKVISTGAFRSCAGLKTVELPTGVELYESVFSLSGLESIELKDAKLQDSSIFWSCEQLKSVIIRGNTPLIPDHTFANCTNLTHVKLPETLERIRYDVFSGCSKLRKINFAGTVNQWNSIKMGRPNRYLYGCKIICSDGTLKFDKTVKEWIEV